MISIEPIPHKPRRSLPLLLNAPNGDREIAASLARHDPKLTLAALTAGVALGPVPTALASDTDVVTDLARTAEAVPLVEQVSDPTPSDDRPKKYRVKYVSEISNGDDREGKPVFGGTRSGV
ncbi:hypothetical protein [Streptomyces sp. NPDC051704]|uniref:hypothetical protein n=1 Tax=Streptomyces sp. NPDC051704 TaxID=3365671 RepID=UPI00378E34D2